MIKFSRITPFYLFHLALFILIVFSAQGQVPLNHKIQYSYDAAGNRVKRTVIHLISTPQDKWDPSASNQKEQKPIADSLDNFQLSIYPNPTLGNLTLQASELDPENSPMIFISDLSGRLLLEQKFSELVMSLDFSGYSNGPYILYVTIGERQKEWTVIKK